MLDDDITPLDADIRLFLLPPRLMLMPLLLMPPPPIFFSLFSRRQFFAMNSDARAAFGE